MWFLTSPPGSPEADGILISGFAIGRGGRNLTTVTLAERTAMDSSTATPTPAPAPPPSPVKPKRDQGNLIGGLILVVLGLLFLGDNLLPNFRFGDYWPVILIVIGGALLWKSRNGMNQ